MEVTIGEVVKELQTLPISRLARLFIGFWVHFICPAHLSLDILIISFIGYVNWKTGWLGRW